jgi:hypothetical protein
VGFCFARAVIVTTAAIIVANFEPYAGGLLVAFPAGMTTMMVILWRKQGGPSQAAGA